MTEAGGSLQTEDAAQRQEETKRTQACQEEAEMEGECYPNDRRTGTWKVIAEFFQRDSCLQAITAEFILQGQILPPDPGPRSSTATTTARSTGVTRAAIEQELLTVLGHRQSLGPDEGATSSPRGRIVRSHNRDLPPHSVQRREEARKSLQTT